MLDRSDWFLVQPVSWRGVSALGAADITSTVTIGVFVYVIVATLFAGFAAPAAGLAVLVVGLLTALTIDFAFWTHSEMSRAGSGRAGSGRVDVEMSRTEQRGREAVSHDPVTA